ncbi:MAG: hypothetical protein JO349_07265 [Candidatus Eremiobacteraeota bacterium]|nr:hypothetical protein [Candidatus Eremiobacteraeota bacterium]
MPNLGLAFAALTVWVFALLMLMNAAYRTRDPEQRRSLMTAGGLFLILPLLAIATRFVFPDLTYSVSIGTGIALIGVLIWVGIIARRNRAS